MEPCPQMEMGNLPLDLPERDARDAQYRVSSSVTQAEFEATVARYSDLSQKARDTLPCHCGLIYDTASGSRLDLFPAGEGAPLLVFIHGGYWRMLSKADSAFMAPSFVKHGISVATLDYQLAPQVTLPEIVRQVRAAITWLMNQGRAYGVDPTAIWVTGSSAGGHLAAMCAATDWPLARHLRGIMPVSGLFDLRPIARSFINDWLRLDDTSAVAMSPSLSPLPSCPVYLAWGEREPDVFKGQSLHYHARLAAAAIPGAAFEVPERHHFDVILDLADSASSLTRTFLSIILGETPPPNIKAGHFIERNTTNHVD